MIIGTALPFVTEFIEALDEAIKKHNPGCSLSRIHKTWLSFCIMAILITNSVCWARFERASLRKYSMSTLSWMFRHSKIPWNLLLCKAVEELETPRWQPYRGSGVAKSTRIWHHISPLVPTRNLTPF